MSQRVSGEHGGCRFAFDGAELALANAQIERRWAVRDGRLYASSFRDLRSGREWFAGPSPMPSLALGQAGGELKARWHGLEPTELEEPSLVVEVHGVATWRFRMFAGATGVMMQVVAPAGKRAAAGELAAGQPSGIEGEPSAAPHIIAQDDILEAFTFDPLHRRFIAVELRDRTDVTGELAFERQWLLHPSESAIEQRGNLFFLEDTLSGDGLAMVKHAPLPHARPVKCQRDVILKGGGTVWHADRTVSFVGGSCALLGHGIGPEGGEGYPLTMLAYRGGREGRTAALHDLQRQLRRYSPRRDGLLLSNTWGDRSRDARVNEEFVLREVEAGARLGVDVVQIDDGWQRGTTSNSATPGGVWSGFWDRDGGFWEPHPQRFPRGLRPVIDRARRHDMGFGLWFAPDSANDYANWQRDAEAVLRLHRDLGVSFFKIDGVTCKSRLAEANLRRFFDHVLRESGGAVTFDLDVTASIRPGYFGLQHAGCIFVENRYTDWHNYWPHHTLRNLWTLAHYIDPVRLRMEFLNNRRNEHLYAGDPLAPSRYSPAYLFAAVMFSSPLAWCEVSNLPEDYVREAGALVRVWKEHRGRIFAGRIVPIGEQPDGTSWTGFASACEGGGGYLLVFREQNDRPTCTLRTSLLSADGAKAAVLAGEGEIRPGVGGFEARIDRPLGFCFARIEGRRGQWTHPAAAAELRTGGGEGG